ncbi:MAG: competence/damage-inducible protein A [Clostridiales bacterium]|nr:competence/damage-inducible protein A [Clostridiales bacterium]
MKASIIAVGTELLFGQTINTNAAFLSEELNHMGFSVMYHYVVGDNPQRLKETLAEAFQNTDVVLLTGGLGPTQDDLTKEVVADYMDADLYCDEAVIKDLDEHFAKRGVKMPENNLKQAYLPVGCTPLYNPSGTAPGFALLKEGKCAMCFPGPPREMKWLFEHGARQYLMELVDRKMFYRIIRTIGIGESDLEMKLLPLIDNQTDPTIATYAKEGECTMRVASQRDTMEEAEDAVEEMIASINEIVGEYIYSVDNENLNEVVVRMLKEQNLILTCAESATGGMFGANITEVTGASAVFKQGFIVYSNEAKTTELGVRPETIDSFGVVSAEVAKEMAVGAQRKAKADIAVSVTGFAGPEVESGYTPGDAFVGYAYRDKVGSIEIHKNRIIRAWNRNIFMTEMLKTIYLLLKEDLK